MNLIKFKPGEFSKDLGRYLRQGIVTLQLERDTINLRNEQNFKAFTINDNNIGIDTTFYIAQIDSQMWKQNLRLIRFPKKFSSH